MRLVTTAILLISLALAVVMGWGDWNLNEDLYVALCAGRDVVGGQLGQPDQWSFATGGKIWVNQSWLSGLIYYLSYVKANLWGPILLKGILLIACLPLLFYRLRLLGVSRQTSLFALFLGTGVMAPWMSIRPENFGILYSVLITTLLVAPRKLGLLRQAGCLLVMLIWSNSHGSFVLGFIFMGLKILSPLAQAAMYRVAARRQMRKHGKIVEKGHDAVDRWDLGLWVIAWISCIPLMAFANPYGPDNLLMPFMQVGTEAFTRTNPHWWPLIWWGWPPKAPVPQNWLFVCLVLLCVGLIVLTVLMVRKKGVVGFLLSGPLQRNRSDLFVEIVSSLILVAVTFRHGRFILFAAPAMVPCLGLLMQSWTEAFDSYAGSSTDGRLQLLRTRLTPVLSVALLVAVVWVFCVHTLIPYLPGNPVLPESSLAKRIIGHFPLHLTNVTEFMKKNRIKGRVFSNWVISDFLFFRVPDIKLFVGCRAQSIYSERSLRDYLTIANLDRKNRAQKAQVLRILDDYRVSAVTIESKVVLAPLVELLCKSKRWNVVYVDPYVLVFVRKGSAAGDISPATDQQHKVWYPDALTRTLSTAYFEFYSTGKMSPEVKGRLKQVAQKTPVAVIYSALFLTGCDRKGCLREQSASYFLNELKRLSKMDIMRPDGVNSVLGSMNRILGILVINKESCWTGRPTPDFVKMRNVVRRTEKRVRTEYQPLGYALWRDVAGH